MAIIKKDHKKQMPMRMWRKENPCLLEIGAPTMENGMAIPWGVPDSSVGKESACSAGDSGLIPGSGRSSREGKGYSLLHSWASLVAQLGKNPPAMW